MHRIPSLPTRNLDQRNVPNCWKSRELFSTRVRSSRKTHSGGGLQGEIARLAASEESSLVTS